MKAESSKQIPHELVTRLELIL